MKFKAQIYQEEIKLKLVRKEIEKEKIFFQGIKEVGNEVELEAKDKIAVMLRNIETQIYMRNNMQE